MRKPRIWREDWLETRRPHDPQLVRRGDRSEGFRHFGQYSENSIRKWMGIRGYPYELRLFNGQLVKVRPKQSPSNY